MGLMDFIKGELIDVIEWTDDSRDTLSYRFPDDDKAIKNGAQLIVRESQQVQFVYLGEFGDTFGPGKHTLTTDNIPVLTKLKSWKYGFNSPFKADVYYVTTRLFTGNKWGTANPIMMRDDDLGIVRARAFGTYDFRIVDPKLFLKEVAGSDQNFRLDEFADTMRSRIVSVFADALASAKIPVFDVASRYSELGEALLPLINPVIDGEVRHRDRELHRRERVGAAGSGAGDRQAVEHGGGRQPERLREVPDGAGDGEGRQRPAAWRPSWPSACRSRSRSCSSRGCRPARGASAAAARRGRAAGPAVARPTSPRRSASPKRTCMAIIESGELAGEEDRLVLAHQALRAGRVPGEVESDRARCTRIADIDGTREVSVRRLRRAGGVEPGASRCWSARSAAPSRPSPSIDATGALVEHDLVEALRELPDEARGWLAEKRTVQCQSCKAVSVFDPERVGQNCDFCGSPALVDYQEIKAPIRPQSLLPFKVAESAVREQIRRWYTSKWLAPGNLEVTRARRPRPRRLHPVLDVRRAGRLPVGSRGGALLLHDRDATATTRATRRRGRCGTSRWEPASGVVEHFFDDEPVPGTHGVSHDLLQKIEPFPTTELVAYDTAYLSGFVVEHYQVVLLDAAEQSQDAMTAAAASRCASAQVPGDTQRNLRDPPDVLGADLQAHPGAGVAAVVHLSARRSTRCWSTATTGQMAGDYPKSSWKIFFLVVGYHLIVVVADRSCALSQERSRSDVDV